MTSLHIKAHRLLVACLHLGYFPTKGKMWKLVSTPKLLDKDQATIKYMRPETLLGKLGKPLERPIFLKIFEIWPERDFIYASQFGIQKSKSTLEAVSKLLGHSLFTFIDIIGVTWFNRTCSWGRTVVWFNHNSEKLSNRYRVVTYSTFHTIDWQNSEYIVISQWSLKLVP